MMRPMWLVVLGMLALMVCQPAMALERGLAGVNLGSGALQLLTSAAFGTPQYIGPIGLSVDSEAAKAAAQAAAAKATTTGRGAGYVQASGLNVTSGGGGAGFVNYGPPRATAEAAPVRPAMQQGPGGEPAMVWLYKRNYGAVWLLVELDAEGKVTGVTVDGRSYATAMTARQVTLGNTYNQIVAKYGFPDQTATEGGALVVRYLEPGLVFRLVDLRVTAMRLTTRPTSGIPGAGATTAGRGLGTPSLGGGGMATQGVIGPGGGGGSAAEEF